MKTYVFVFVSVFLAEIGDKTQLATLLFATDRSVSRTGIVIAAASALIASTVLAVAAGAWLGSWLAPERLRLLAGLGFVAIGLWMLIV